MSADRVYVMTGPYEYLWAPEKLNLVEAFFEVAVLPYFEDNEFRKADFPEASPQFEEFMQSVIHPKEQVDYRALCEWDLEVLLEYFDEWHIVVAERAH